MKLNNKGYEDLDDRLCVQIQSIAKIFQAAILTSFHTAYSTV